jgi:dTDP-4-dehydrorhamnose reductase
VYASRGENFAKTMIRLAGERDQLRVVDDQVGVPTSAELIADITAHCVYQVIHNKALSKQAVGLYHLVPSGEISWHGFAQFVLKEARCLGGKMGVKPENIQAICTEAYPLPAKRPKNSRLSANKLQQMFNITLPDWQCQAKRMIREIYG